MGLNQPGTTFHDMFSLPPGAADRKEVEGSNEDNPIVLPVLNRDFQAFLQVLYPSCVLETTVFTLMTGLYRAVARNSEARDSQRQKESGRVFWNCLQCGDLQRYDTPGQFLELVG